MARAINSSKPSLRDARCLTCGYELFGLVEHRCPECARAFDPLDGDTFFYDAASPLVHIVRALAGCIMVLPIFVVSTWAEPLYRYLSASPWPGVLFKLPLFVGPSVVVVAGICLSSLTLTQSIHELFFERGRLRYFGLHLLIVHFSGLTMVGVVASILNFMYLP